MSMAEATRKRRGQAAADALFDRELDHLPPEARWREWMQRVEATIFAASEPVSRETLARIVGKSCSIDLLIDDIREELRGRPYDLVSVAGGWKHLTRPAACENRKRRHCVTCTKLWRSTSSSLTATGSPEIRPRP